MQRNITGDTVTIPMLCVKPANANLMRVDVSDDNGKTWRGLGEISAIFEHGGYRNGRYVGDAKFADYQKAEDRFFADLDARGLPYVRCREHAKCDVNAR